MRPVAQIQIEAERRRFEDVAFRESQAAADAKWAATEALAEADLVRIEQLIERYRLTPRRSE